MKVCFIVSPTPETLLKHVSTLQDTAECVGYSSINEFVAQVPIKHESFDRVLLFDADPTYTNSTYLKLDSFLVNAGAVKEIIILTKNKQRESEIRGYLDFPMSIVHTLESRVTPPFLRSLIVSTFEEFKEDNGITSSVEMVTSSSEQPETFRPAVLPPAELLNLSNAGISHADTGFLSPHDLEDSIEGTNSTPVDPMSVAYPPVQLTSWPTPNPGRPSLTPSQMEDLPLLLTGGRVYANVSLNPTRSALYGAAQSLHFTEQGYSVLYIDARSGVHGITDILDDPDEVEAFQPSMSKKLFYQDDRVFIATNGLTSETTLDDLRSALEMVGYFDYTVIDIDQSCDPSFFALIKEACPTTTFTWLVPANLQNFQGFFLSLLNREDVHTDTLEVLATSLPHPGGTTAILPDDTRSFLSNLLPKMLWNRANLTPAFSQIV